MSAPEGVTVENERTTLLGQARAYDIVGAFGFACQGVESRPARHFVT